MSGDALLDTNVVVALLNGEAAVSTRAAKAARLLVPAIVLGELYGGALKSTRVADNLRKVDMFAAAATVLVCDARTARAYAEARDALRRKGRPLPENDIWIASVAIQHGLTLVSRDAHFKEVDGLALEVW